MWTTSKKIRRKILLGKRSTNCGIFIVALRRHDYAPFIILALLSVFWLCSADGSTEGKNRCNRMHAILPHCFIRIQFPFIRTGQNSVSQMEHCTRYLGHLLLFHSNEIKSHGKMLARNLIQFLIDSGNR